MYEGCCALLYERAPAVYVITLFFALRGGELRSHRCTVRIKANDYSAPRAETTPQKMTALFPPRDRGLFSKRPRSFAKETAVFFRPLRSAFKMKSNGLFWLTI